MENNKDNTVIKKYVKIPNRLRLVEYVTVFIDCFEYKSDLINNKLIKNYINCSANFSNKNKYINYEKVTQFSRDYSADWSSISHGIKRVGINKMVLKFK